MPDIAAPDSGRHTVPSGIRVLAHAAAHEASDAGSAAERATGEGSTGNRATGTFPIQWRESREIAGPDIISRIRNFKRDGLPVVRLWQSDQSGVAIGLNPHGVPGIYFTHHVGS